MKKEDMAAAMTGITTRPKATTKGAITGIVPKEEKKAKERKVVSIAEEDCMPAFMSKKICSAPARCLTGN